MNKTRHAPLIAGLLLLCTGPAMTLAESQLQINPGATIRGTQDLRQKKITPEQKQALAAAHIVRARLVVFAHPLQAVCDKGAEPSIRGVVEADIRYLRRPDGTFISANLVVENGTGLVRTPFQLRGSEPGRDTTVSSSNIDFTAREICSDRCVNVRLEPVNPADAKRMSRTPVRACVAS